MEYRAVGNRCAVNINSLNLPMSQDEALNILGRKHFNLLEIDLIAIARQCIGLSQFKRGSRLSQAPDFFDCSGFIKYLYGQRGIWLPRRSVQQSEIGELVELNNLSAGDVVFISGWIDYYRKDPDYGIGHSGIATGEGTVIHAANKKTNLLESAIDSFIGKSKFRVARRYIPLGTEVLTFETPLGGEVEIADDLRWIILQSTTKK